MSAAVKYTLMIELISSSAAELCKLICLLTYNDRCSFTAVNSDAQWKTFGAVAGQRESPRYGEYMQRHAGHFRRVPVADPLIRYVHLEG